MELQWYPGHMTKAKREMQDDLKLVDLVIELLDARIPVSSRNPDLDELGKQKARMILLMKADLADDRWNEEWKSAFTRQGFSTMLINAKNPSDLKKLRKGLNRLYLDQRQDTPYKGVKIRPLRAMVVGIPNVGKSTLINALAGRSSARTGNQPGVTKGKQWIHLNEQMDLLDTPGILWPKFTDQQIGLHLAVVGSLKEELVQEEELSTCLLDFLKQHYNGCLQKVYHVDEGTGSDELLEQIAINQHCVLKGNQPDLSRAAKMLLRDFRNGKLGRITLEYPED